MRKKRRIGRPKDIDEDWTIASQLESSQRIAPPPPPPPPCTMFGRLRSQASSCSASQFPLQSPLQHAPPSAPLCTMSDHLRAKVSHSSLPHAPTSAPPLTTFERLRSTTSHSSLPHAPRSTPLCTMSDHLRSKVSHSSLPHAPPLTTLEHLRSTVSNSSISSASPNPSQPLQPDPPLSPSLHTLSPEVQVQANDDSVTRGRNAEGIPEWNTGVKVHIQFDSSFQPVGPRSSQLKTQLGIIVRDGHKIPLTYLNWKKVGLDVKENIWKEIQTNLVDVPDGYKSVCLKNCNILWKDFKAKTKRYFYEKNKDDPDLISKVPPNVVADQWPVLVAYWEDELIKQRALQNSINREGRGPVHTTGRKSLSQLRYEMSQKGEETDKMSVWSKSRNQSDPVVVEAIEEYNEKLLLEPEDQRNLAVVKDRIFHEVIGEDGHGYCRTYGSGVHPSMVYPRETSSYNITAGNMVDKIREAVAMTFQGEIDALRARINLLENKERSDNDSSEQVQDITSDHEIRRENVGEDVTPHTNNDHDMRHGVETSNAPLESLATVHCCTKKNIKWEECCTLHSRVFGVVIN